MMSRHQSVNRDLSHNKLHGCSPSFFRTSAFDLESVLSSLLDLAGETADAAEPGADDDNAGPAAVPVFPDFVCSTAFEPHSAHCSSWRINGATPSSRLTLANTRNGSTPIHQRKTQFYSRTHPITA